MRRHKTQITTLVSFLMASLFPCAVHADEIPQNLEKVSYFLQAIDTPFWLWFFRIAFCICLLIILVSFFYYQNKKEK